MKYEIKHWNVFVDFKNSYENTIDAYNVILELMRKAIEVTRFGLVSEKIAYFHNAILQQWCNFSTTLQLLTNKDGNRCNLCPIRKSELCDWSGVGCFDSQTQENQDFKASNLKEKQLQTLEDYYIDFKDEMDFYYIDKNGNEIRDI